MTSWSQVQSESGALDAGFIWIYMCKRRHFFWYEDRKWQNSNDLNS